MASYQNLITHSINPNFSVKLDETNYLIWKEQLKHVIIVYGLQSLVDGFASIPSKLNKKQITNSIGNVCEVFEVNIDYQFWDR